MELAGKGTIKSSIFDDTVVAKQQANSHETANTVQRQSWLGSLIFSDQRGDTSSGRASSASGAEDGANVEAAKTGEPGKILPPSKDGVVEPKNGALANSPSRRPPQQSSEQMIIHMQKDIACTCEMIDEVVDDVYDYARKFLGYRDEELILMGRSIGTGAACRLAAKIARRKRRREGSPEKERSCSESGKNSSAGSGASTFEDELCV